MTLVHLAPSLYTTRDRYPLLINIYIYTRPFIPRPSLDHLLNLIIFFSLLLLLLSIFKGLGRLRDGSAPHAALR